MATNIIADAHILNPTDPNFKKVLSFLDVSAKTIIFLGDTFELLVGNSSFYIKTYRPLWDKVKNLLQQGTTIYYFEGNHDFHLKKLFAKLFPYPNFILVKKHLLLTIQDKKYLLSHGDELFESTYNSLVKSKLFYFLANIFPYSWIRFIYSQISKKSYRPSFDPNKLLQQLSPESADYYILGHLHQKLSFNKLLALPSFKHTNTYLQITDTPNFLESVP